jgi:NodT family efflux transporter outer membrane factor (OMF) lipoprotein
VEWWKGFGDPLLDELIDRAGRANLDVRKAVSRFAEAQALRSGSKSSLLPSLDSITSLGSLRGGFNQGVVKVPTGPGADQSASFVSPFDTSIVSTGLTLRWEADVFGALRKSLTAASADAIAAQATLRDVQTSVLAEVARSYIELRAAEEQIAIVRTHLDSEADLLGLIRARADAGLASELDVQRQMSRLASVSAALPDFDALRLQAVHRIGVLVGKEPNALVERLETTDSRLQVPPAAGSTPAELLRRRPDIRRAEAQVAAAYARAGAARADLHPKFVFTGLFGRQATELTGLTIGAGNFFSVGPGISLPIFNFGRIRAQIAAQDARLEQAIRSYEQEALAALEEMENAFVARDRAEQRQRDLEVAVRAARQSTELARELYLRGLADFLSVLEAQRGQFEAGRALAAAKAAVLQGAVAIYHALGD